MPKLPPVRQPYLQLLAKRNVAGPWGAGHLKAASDQPVPGHKAYPYLLKGMKIAIPNSFRGRRVGGLQYHTMALNFPYLALPRKNGVVSPARGGL